MLAEEPAPGGDGPEGVYGTCLLMLGEPSWEACGMGKLGGTQVLELMRR
jgi:hypothetical protein